MESAVAIGSNSPPVLGICNSPIHPPSVFRDLDFKTIDKLSMMDKEFEKPIEQTKKIVTASEKYVAGAEKELDEFC